MIYNCTLCLLGVMFTLTHTNELAGPPYGLLIESGKNRLTSTKLLYHVFTKLSQSIIPGGAEPGHMCSAC